MADLDGARPVNGAPEGKSRPLNSGERIVKKQVATGADIFDEVLTGESHEEKSLDELAEAEEKKAQETEQTLAIPSRAPKSTSPAAKTGTAATRAKPTQKKTEPAIKAMSKVASKAPVKTAVKPKPAKPAPIREGEDDDDGDDDKDDDDEDDDLEPGGLR